MSKAPFYDQGAYVCRVTQQGFGESRNGNPMILIGVEPIALITKTQTGEEDLQYVTQNYERMVRLVISTDDQKDYAMQKLRYAGFTGESFNDLNLVGADVRCNCEHQDGQGEHAGRVFEQWDLQLPRRERTEIAPLDQSAARKLDALFGRRLKKVPKPEPEGNPELVAPVAVPTDDEVPF